MRDGVREIGYVHEDDMFHADKIDIQNVITSQSPDISQGVERSEAAGKGHAEQGAGDQGLMFGYACDETAELMPARSCLPIGSVANSLASARDKTLSPSRCQEPGRRVFTRAASRSVAKVVISTQHARDVKQSEIPQLLSSKTVIPKVLPN